MQNTKINKHKKRLCKQIVLACAHSKKNDKQSPNRKWWEEKKNKKL
jgi:hypothetical protein